MLEMGFELMFWAMTLALITAIFVCGMLLGGWLTWRFFTTSSNDKEKTKSLADADARIEDLTNKIEEITAVSRRRNTEITNHEVLYITCNGARFHAKADCSGLSRANDISTKTACRLCVAALQGQ
jgi:hypothetical protein